MNVDSESLTRTFAYEGYDIPVHLIDLTGGGTDTWDAISKGHMREYEDYAPIEPGHTVLEVGCGIGRDAIQLTKILSEDGRYIGVDITKPSIEWCQQNIARRWPSFEFHHCDVYSPFYNSGGRGGVNSVKMPAAQNSVDRIVLHSVFTHMFRQDIVHYMKEFRRVLKPDGLVMASMFVLDEESREMAKTSEFPLKFEHEYGGGCWICDKDYPEGAIGYDLAVVEKMLKVSGLKMVQDIHRGAWSGRQGVSDGQDILVLAKDFDSKPSLLQRLGMKK